MAGLCILEALKGSGQEGVVQVSGASREKKAEFVQSGILISHVV